MPWTSRNCNASAPGTTRERQVAPPSVVRAKVPPRPLAQTTRSLTGLMACRRLAVPLCWGVSVGVRGALSSAPCDAVGDAVGAGSTLPFEQPASAAPPVASAAARDRETSALEPFWFRISPSSCGGQIVWAGGLRCQDEAPGRSLPQPWRKCITSPSRTTYSLPSMASLPASRALASLPRLTKSSHQMTSALMNFFSKSV
jgi:hypothetical protein